MRPDEYGVCVTSGYGIRTDGKAGGQRLRAEAIVYMWGGRTVARFEKQAQRDEDVREAVRARAEAWIAADDATRDAMQAAESLERTNSRTLAWQAWLA